MLIFVILKDQVDVEIEGLDGELISLAKQIVRFLKAVLRKLLSLESVTKFEILLGSSEGVLDSFADSDMKALLLLDVWRGVGVLLAVGCESGKGEREGTDSEEAKHDDKIIIKKRRI